jgi:hypothetical protein
MSIASEAVVVVDKRRLVTVVFKNTVMLAVGIGAIDEATPKVAVCRGAPPEQMRTMSPVNSVKPSDLRVGVTAPLVTPQVNA